MSRWKLPLEIPKVALSKLDIQQRITRVYTKHQDIPKGLKLDELNSKLNHDTTVFFKDVEEYVIDFIECFLPSHVDQIYRYNDLLHDNPASRSYLELHNLVQEVKAEVEEINKLRQHIYVHDLDDFDVCIKPAKHKIKAALQFFLATASNRKIHYEVEFSSSTDNMARSPKARDLLSFLPDLNCHGGDANHVSQSCEFDSGKVDIKVEEACNNVSEAKLRYDFFDLENMEDLNDDLRDLLKLMHEFHESLKSEEAAERTANTEEAINTVQDGGTAVSRTTLLKAVLFPVAGAVIGSAVAGPIGFMAGMKVGSVTGGLATAGITGSVIGYQLNVQDRDSGLENLSGIPSLSGKFLRKKKDVVEQQAADEAKSSLSRSTENEPA